MTDLSHDQVQPRLPAGPWPRRLAPVTAKPVGTLFNVFLAVLSPLLALLTVLVVYVPGFYLAVEAPELDAVLNTATTVAAGAIAVLAWFRFREADQRDALYQAAAFLLLFAGGVLNLVLFLTHMDGPLGFASAAPGQAPLYIWTIERVLAALLLVLGALAVLKRWPRPGSRLALVVVIGPIVAMAGLAMAVISARQLPALVPPSMLSLLGQPGGAADLSRLSMAMFIVQLVVAVLFLVAAYAYARLHASDRRPYSAYLEIALIVAAFSQVHSAIVPGPYTGLVTSGGVLRLTFYAILLIGVAHAARLDLIALRQANESLIRLQSADAARIASEERARVARDIHDGLAQELWLARLTNAGFKDIKNVPGEARKLANRVDGILEDALAEARFAVATLQPSDFASVGAELQRLVDDYADHFGLEIQLTVDSDASEVPDHTRAELMRICREALNNVRKHADASVVRVRLRSDGETLRLAVSDNGKGFDTAAVEEGYGLRGMRYRAEAIGGTLFIESEPLGGTQVIVEVPTVDGEPV